MNVDKRMINIQDISINTKVKRRLPASLLNEDIKDGTSNNRMVIEKPVHRFDASGWAVYLGNDICEKEPD